MHRLYRGQPKEYRDFPLVPSALRNNCIVYLEQKLLKSGINIEQYKIKCIPNKILKQYCNSAYQPPQEAFYAYWLSLVNCSLAVNNNHICYEFCRSPFFKNNFNENGAGVYLLSSNSIADVCFDYAKDFFDSEKPIETYHLQLILHDYAFFQHINYALSKLNGNSPVLYPTLALDWTWNLSIAKRFAGKNGNIISISWEAYEEWNAFKNHRVCNIFSGENKIPVFGFETFLETSPWNKYDWYSMDNNLMVEQEGAVIFWPWKFTIDQLRLNALGEIFDLKLEK